jgi:hypothetical protein
VVRWVKATSLQLIVQLPARLLQGQGLVWVDLQQIVLRQVQPSAEIAWCCCSIISVGSEGVKLNDERLCIGCRETDSAM